MIILLLSCVNRLDFNMKTTREEISQAIAEDNTWKLKYLSHDELHKENAQSLLPIEEAIDKEKIEAIDIFLKKIHLDYIQRVAIKAVERNSIEIYKMLKENEFLSFCLKIAKEESNSVAISKILEIMEATELEKEILLGTEESVKLGGKLKEGNESIIAVSEEEIFEIIKERVTNKVFLECVKLGYREKVLKLIDKVEIRDKTKTGMTALMYAAGYNYEEVVRIILGKVDVEYINTSNQKGWTALMFASKYGHAKIVKVLLEASAKIDEKIARGIEKNRTALMLASSHGYEEVVSLLLQAGAKVDEKTEGGLTSLMFAAVSGYERVARVLLEASAKIDEKILTILQEGETALMLASSHGYEEVVSLLLQARAKVDEKDKHGWTALMKASANGYEKVVSLLLQAGAKVDEKTESGWTALMWATSNGCEGVVSILLQAGANINIKNLDGQHSLIRASFGNPKKNFEMIKFLLSKGADSKVVFKFHGNFYNFLVLLNIKYVFELLDLGLINIHDVDDNKMTNFYNILKNLEGEKNLAKYKMLLVTLLTRYGASRLF